jgi:hypothetical protein
MVNDNTKDHNKDEDKNEDKAHTHRQTTVYQQIKT